MDNPIQLKCIKPGLHTLVIVQNRMGLQKFGVPIGGPMDSSAAGLANWLVGNKEKDPVIEITLQGPVIEFSESCQIAITGAKVEADVNAKPVEQNKTIKLNKGDILTIKSCRIGARAYLAIRGNWQLNDWKNSLQNRVIKKDDELLIKPPSVYIDTREKKIGLEKERVKILAMPGPEWDTLNDATRNAIASTIFSLLPDSNRMGYRLSPNVPEIFKSIISSGVIPGALQITPEGLPILIMQDGPTTGGYVRALTVLSSELPKLGQLRPGGSFNFLIQ